MFKNMIVYRIAESWQGDLQLLEEALGKSLFAECGATQERSAGWVPPRMARWPSRWPTNG
jgi:recombination associated protein RdgC